MVSVAVSKLGCLSLVFVDPGAKVNGTYYSDESLSKQLLPDTCRIAGDTFVFQQDSAPAHRARETIYFLSHATPQFIGPDLWPPNSPDLNLWTLNFGVSCKSEFIRRLYMISMIYRLA